MQKQILSFAALQKTLTDYNKKQRVKPVENPCAQYATKLQGSMVNEQAVRSIYSSVMKNQAVPEVVKAVMSLQFHYGLRISEVLNISVYDIGKAGHIHIKGTKGSNDRIVKPFECLNFWHNSNSSILPLISVYSRWFFYRWYKRLGISFNYVGLTNNSVTHVFRHEVIKGLSADFKNSELSQKFIGHRSVKSTKHYERKRK